MKTELGRAQLNADGFLTQRRQGAEAQSEFVFRLASLLLCGVISEIRCVKQRLFRSADSIVRAFREVRKQHADKAVRAPLAAPLLLRALAFILLPFGLAAATNDLTGALQRGLFEEEANHNLEAAAQAYQAVSAQFEKDRKLAATAIFRLGEVYRKQGKTNEAVAQYERIVREFSDQQTLVTLSRQNLGGMGDRAETVTTLPLSPAARQEQRRLLDAEIKLVEQDLAELKKQMEVGRATQADVRAKEREVLQLRRRSVALESGGSESTETPGALLDDEEKEIRRIQAMIQNSPDLINAARGEEGTPLYQAAIKGQLQVAKFLLEHGAAVNAPNGISGKTYSGWTPLMGAASGGHKAMVELLLTHGADVKARDRQGRTALHQTAQRGFEAVIKTLLDHQADANARDDYEATPFHLVVLESPKAVIELLLARGAEVNAVTAKEFSVGSRFGFVSGGSPLHLAVRRGERPVVELLLDRKADVNAAAKGGMYGGRTPLQEAVSGGRTELVELLLQRGADPNAGVKDLPLAAAALRQNVEIARLLLRGGAKPDLASKTSQQVLYPGAAPYSASGNEFGPFTPLQIAVAQRDAAMVKLLLEFKADANGKDPWTSPPSPLLRWTIGDAEMLKAFLAAGADANASDGSGFTALHSAIGADCVECVDALLSHGADTEIMRNGVYSPLRVAVERGVKKIVEALLKAGAKINAQGGGPARTALHQAVEFRDLELTTQLLEHGADPNLRDASGRTPLDSTADRTPRIGQARSPLSTSRPLAGQKELAELLRRHGALDDLPALDRIQVRRPSTDYSAVVFWRGTNDWNQFTLLELIGVEYGLLATRNDARPVHGHSVDASRAWAVENERGQRNSLPFPNLDRVVIIRATPDGKSRKVITVDVTSVLRTGDCSADVVLHWGDLVEIAETDHPVTERWAGFSMEALASLAKCLTRKVTITVKDQTVPQRVAPGIFIESGKLKALSSNSSFALLRVLEESRLLRSSSDLSRVSVTRRNPAPGERHEWVVDCKVGSVPDLWLRDGDVIEVPDKQ